MSLPARSALALCFAMSAGAAQAQSSVTLYGLVDAAVQWIDTSSGNTFAVNSGGRSGSRLGFRGSEDLGGGLNAFFTLESGINLDTGGFGQGGKAFGRQSFVGLKGDWGTVALGRVGLFSSGVGTFDFFSSVDPLIAGYGTGGVGATMSSASGLRADNSILYQSPMLGGFQFGALYSPQFADPEVSPSGANIHVTSLAGKYVGGPFTAVATYDVFNNPAGPDEKHFQLGAAYDLKVVKLFAAYAHEDDLFNTATNISGTTNGAGAKSYMVGATAPLGTGLLRASYQSRDGDQRAGEDRDVRVYTVAYEYSMSKRTMLYTAYSNSDGRGTLNNNPTYDRKVFSLGLLHQF